MKQDNSSPNVSILEDKNRRSQAPSTPHPVIQNSRFLEVILSFNNLELVINVFNFFVVAKKNIYTKLKQGRVANIGQSDN